MIGRLSRSLCWCVVAVVFSVAGCKSESTEPETPIGEGEAAVVSIPEKIACMPDYAREAFEAAGTLQNWTETEKIILDCVVTFYEADGSYYLTEHNYKIAPWLNSIHVSVFEPQGNVVWELSDDQLRVLEGIGKPDALPEELSKQSFAELVLNIVTVPVRFLNEGKAFSLGPHAVKLKGLWYTPIESSRVGFWSKVVFYERWDTSMVDRIWFFNAGEKRSLVVKGYDYREVQGAVLVPGKIEIYRADRSGVLKERLIKIDVK